MVLSVVESVGRSICAAVDPVGAATACGAFAGGAGWLTDRDGVGAVEAAALGVVAVSDAGGVAGPRDADGNNLGVTTMTSAMRTSATMVRLSMQVRDLVREPDHNRRDGTDDSVRFAAPPTNYREARRVARVLQWHTLNSSDNSGTTMGAAAIEQPDTRVRAIRGKYASRLHAGLGAGEPFSHRDDVSAQRRKFRRVGFMTGANRDVARCPIIERRQELDAHELAEPTLEPVSIDRRMAVSRNDDSDARMSERGSEGSDIQMHGPNSLPLSNDRLQVEAPRQPIAPRKSEAVVRRLRTCLAT